VGSGLCSVGGELKVLINGKLFNVGTLGNEGGCTGGANVNVVGGGSGSFCLVITSGTIMGGGMIKVQTWTSAPDTRGAGTAENGLPCTADHLPRKPCCRSNPARVREVASEMNSAS
jgi:hypothetical protein